MCDATTLGLVLSAASNAQSMLKKPPAVKPPETLLSASMRGIPTRAPTGGYNSTLLTGASGVPAGSQNIGTNKLLGQ